MLIARGWADKWVGWRVGELSGRAGGQAAGWAGIWGRFALAVWPIGKGSLGKALVGQYIWGRMGRVWPNVWLSRLLRAWRGVGVGQCRVWPELDGQSSKAQAHGGTGEVEVRHGWAGVIN